MKGVNPMDCVKFYETGDATCVSDLSLGLCGEGISSLVALTCSSGRCASLAKGVEGGGQEMYFIVNREGVFNMSCPIDCQPGTQDCCSKT